MRLAVASLALDGGEPARGAKEAVATAKAIDDTKARTPMVRPWRRSYTPMARGFRQDEDPGDDHAGANQRRRQVEVPRTPVRPIAPSISSTSTSLSGITNRDVVADIPAMPIGATTRLIERTTHELAASRLQGLSPDPCPGRENGVGQSRRRRSPTGRRLERRVFIVRVAIASLMA